MKSGAGARMGSVLASNRRYSSAFVGSSLSHSLDRDAVAPGVRAAVYVERRSGTDRRRMTLRSFLRGGLTPRRREGRRAGEHHLPIDWHEPYLLFLSLMILLLSVADAFLTLTLIIGGAQEANPLLAFILRDHPELFAAVKMALTGTGVLVLVATARSRLFRIFRVGAVLQGLFVCYVALIAYEWWLLRTFL
jgi:hypothetical protein